jgi:hypothetical protein
MARQNRSKYSIYLADSVSGVTPAMIDWREHLASSPQGVAEGFLAPADSAGFYWSKTKMAFYADQPLAIVRNVVTATLPPRHRRDPQPAGSLQSKIYYGSPNFWDASAAVNYPAAVGRPERRFNGYIARCVGFAQVLAVTGETWFADSNGKALVFPQGSNPRRS